MTTSSDRDDSSSGDHRGRRSLGAKSKVGGIAAVLLVAVYSFAAPQLNSRYGWNLPQVRTDSGGNVRLAETQQQPKESSATVSESEDPKEPAASKPTAAKQGTARQDAAKQDAKKPTASKLAATKPQSGTGKPASGGPLADRMRSSSIGSGDTSKTAAGDPQVSGDDSDDDLLHGLLREISHDRFVSPAGLLYTPGSAEGHRLEHLRRHIKDNPGRPGSHGVFDGEMEGALKTIDRAYELAKKNQRTTKKVDGERTIYTVDMGGRVGYVGGRDGGRRRKPMARRVRIVLEGNRFITAYPM